MKVLIGMMTEQPDTPPPAEAVQLLTAPIWDKVFNAYVLRIPHYRRFQWIGRRLRERRWHWLRQQFEAKHDAPEQTVRNLSDFFKKRYNSLPSMGNRLWRWISNSQQYERSSKRALNCLSPSIETPLAISTSDETAPILITGPRKKANSTPPTPPSSYTSPVGSPSSHHDSRRNSDGLMFRLSDNNGHIQSSAASAASSARTTQNSSNTDPCLAPPSSRQHDDFSPNVFNSVGNLTEKQVLILQYATVVARRTTQSPLLSGHKMGLLIFAARSRKQIKPCTPFLNNILKKKSKNKTEQALRELQDANPTCQSIQTLLNERLIKPSKRKKLGWIRPSKAALNTLEGLLKADF